MNMRLKFLFVIVLLVTAASGRSEALPAELENYDPSGHIRFETLGEAEARRQKLIEYFWPSGLPIQTLPKVTKDVDFPADLLITRKAKKSKKAIDTSLVRSVDRLDFTVRVTDPGRPSVGVWSMQSVGYWLKPHQTTIPARLAFFHTGHQRNLGLDPGNTAMVEALLRNGIHVIQLDMPMCGRNNTDSRKTITHPDGSTTMLGPGSQGHNELFKRFADHLGGNLFAFFIEPVVQSINLFNQTHPAQDITFIGKSGGGWAAHVVAAVDTRIDLSLPVAGSLPLYARKFAGGSHDAEQYYTPLYKEIDTDGDNIADTAAGVASWMEIYALGAIGEGRRQIQINIFNDPCCFSSDVYESYDDYLSRLVEKIGGRWAYHSDRSQDKHFISKDVRENVILPAIKELYLQAGQIKE